MRACDYNAQEEGFETSTQFECKDFKRKKSGAGQNLGAVYFLKMRMVAFLGFSLFSSYFTKWLTDNHKGPGTAHSFEKSLHFRSSSSTGFLLFHCFDRESGMKDLSKSKNKSLGGNCSGFFFVRLCMAFSCITCEKRGFL